MLLAPVEDTGPLDPEERTRQDWDLLYREFCHMNIMQLDRSSDILRPSRVRIPIPSVRMSKHGDREVDKQSNYFRRLDLRRNTLAFQASREVPFPGVVKN